jgi:hypothetical protein
MRRYLPRLVLTGALLSPATLYALGLGEIRLNSVYVELLHCRDPFAQCHSSGQLAKSHFQSLHFRLNIPPRR